MRIASLDEIRARQDEIWRADLGLREPTAETKRLLRTVYRMSTAIAQGFAPLVWDDEHRGWLFARRAMCVECGHVVATNQPSWMRKHAARQHGRHSDVTISDLLVD